MDKFFNPILFLQNLLSEALWEQIHNHQDNKKNKH